MDYLEMIRQRDPAHIALIEDGTEYTYGDLVELAEKASCDQSVFRDRDSGGGKRLHLIRRGRILLQLTEFLASSILGMVPVIFPADVEFTLPESVQAPENVCMAAATSGSSGEPKILYRTYASWADFFPVQNEIFKITENSRLFAQGSLAFTGNLNLYLAQFFAGGTVVAENAFRPGQWEQIFEEQNVNAIYLIPSKLFCLPKVMKRKNSRIQSIISGSQGIGREKASLLKQYFPEAEIILYYGASELSYITYVKDCQMNGRDNLVGKPFPGVRISVRQGEIFADTPYRAEGIAVPYSVSDRGSMDEDGNLYFEGRGGDIVQIHGRKISLQKIEREICRLDGVSRAAALLLEKNPGEKGCLVAFLCTEENRKIDETFCLATLRRRLAAFEMPGRIIQLEEMPENESGKVDKKKLQIKWCKKKS